MDLDVLFVGTAGSAPSARRGLPATLLRRGGDRLLFDNGDGGTGRGFDWSLIADHPELPRAIVAGGIGAHNARTAQALGAHAIDLCSSVEDQPGLKSAAKIRGLFEALRPASREQLRACA